MPKVFLTGASGFIGQVLAEELVRQKYEVVCLVRRTSNLKYLEKLPVKFVYGDVGNKESLKNISIECDYVVHTAGLTRAKSKEEFFRVNAEGVRNLFEKLQESQFSIKKVMALSSQAVSGPADKGIPVTEEDGYHPLTWYGESKAEGEKIALGYKDRFNVVVLRPPAVYGPYDKDFYQSFKSIQKGLMPFIGFKEINFSIVYVKDLVKAIITCLEESTKTGSIYFVTNPGPCSWREFASLIAKAMHRKIMPVYIPLTLVKFFARLGDIISIFKPRPPLISSQKIKELTAGNWICSSQKIKDELGFECQYSLEQGINETLAWYKQNGWL